MQTWNKKTCTFIFKLNKIVFAFLLKFSIHSLLIHLRCNYITYCMSKMYLQLCMLFWFNSIYYFQNERNLLITCILKKLFNTNTMSAVYLNAHLRTWIGTILRLQFKHVYSSYSLLYLKLQHSSYLNLFWRFTYEKCLTVF